MSDEEALSEAWKERLALLLAHAESRKPVLEVLESDVRALVTPAEFANLLTGYVTFEELQNELAHERNEVRARAADLLTREELETVARAAPGAQLLGKTRERTEDAIREADLLVQAARCTQAEQARAFAELEKNQRGLLSLLEEAAARSAGTQAGAELARALHKAHAAAAELGAAAEQAHSAEAAQADAALLRAQVRLQQPDAGGEQEEGGGEGEGEGEGGDAGDPDSDDEMRVLRRAAAASSRSARARPSAVGGGRGGGPDPLSALRMTAAELERAQAVRGAPALSAVLRKQMGISREQALAASLTALEEALAGMPGASRALVDLDALGDSLGGILTRTRASVVGVSEQMDADLAPRLERVWADAEALAGVMPRARVLFEALDRANKDVSEDPRVADAATAALVEETDAIKAQAVKLARRVHAGSASIGRRLGAASDTGRGRIAGAREGPGAGGAGGGLVGQSASFEEAVNAAAVIGPRMAGRVRALSEHLERAEAGAAAGEAQTGAVQADVHAQIDAVAAKVKLMHERVRALSQTLRKGNASLRARLAAAEREVAGAHEQQRAAVMRILAKGASKLGVG